MRPSDSKWRKILRLRVTTEWKWEGGWWMGNRKNVFVVVVNRQL